MRERGQAGSFWLVPAKAGLCFYDEQGVKTDLVSYLKKREQKAVVDVWIQAGIGDRLPCRLIAVRLNRAGRSY